MQDSQYSQQAPQQPQAPGQPYQQPQAPGQPYQQPQGPQQSYQQPRPPYPPTQPYQGGGLNWGAEIQYFFKEDLKNMIVNLFKFPATGTQRYLENSHNNVVPPLFMLALSVVGLTFYSFIMSALFSHSVSADCLIVGITPIFFSLFITLFMFIFMAIKQKPDFLLAFRHSAVHVLIYTIAMIVFDTLLEVFVGNINFFELAYGNASGLKFVLFLLIFVLVYALSMGISASRQTLRSCDASGKEAYAWYIAPVVVVLAVLITFYLLSAMMF